MPMLKPHECNECHEWLSEGDAYYVHLRCRVGDRAIIACRPCIDWARDHRLVVGGTVEKLGCRACV